MEKHYQYKINGRGSNDQTWEVEGTIESNFVDMFTNVMLECFKTLTQGKAIYGKPGVGCQGPYDVTKIVIEHIKH
jgi:hypothetical protein